MHRLQCENNEEGVTILIVDLETDRLFHSVSSKLTLVLLAHANCSTPAAIADSSTVAAQHSTVQHQHSPARAWCNRYNSSKNNYRLYDCRPKEESEELFRLAASFACKPHTGQHNTAQHSLACA